MERETVVEAGLHTGQELTAAQIEELGRKERYRRCMNAAGHLLGHRMRSERELLQRLSRLGYDDATVSPVISRLRELGLVDDAEFARTWTDNREHCSPRSRRLLKIELQQKGLPREIIESAVDAVDDFDSACRAARKKAPALIKVDYDLFKRRMASFLGRRGFNYETINKTIDVIWKENTTG
jgi:regulatory protein